MLPFFIGNWKPLAAAAILLALAWGVLRYGTYREEAGAAKGRLESTKEIEKNIRAQYETDLQKLQADRQAVEADRSAVNAARQTLTKERTLLERSVAEQIGNLDIKYREELSNANRIPDSDLRPYLRDVLGKLRAGSASNPATAATGK